MDIRPVANREAWEAAVERFRPPTFLQSWAWGEAQAALGEEVVRLVAYDGTSVVGIAQAVTVTARRARFLHVPHGPTVEGSRQSAVGSGETIGALLRALQEGARQRGVAFLRVSPGQEDTPENRALYRTLGFRPAPIYLHAERLWVLDVTPSEDVLLAGMRKTTRNLIRRAEREGIRVTLSRAPGDLTIFSRLYEETARREAFVAFPKRLLEEELKCFGDSAVIGTAYQGNNPLASAIAVFTPWSGFYHHGASSRLRPHSPASYALQWALICEAKRRGCAAYNFWGIYGTDNRRAGITLFKTGFGGREVRLVPTQDYPLSPRYWPTYVLDTWRRWKRSL